MAEKSYDNGVRQIIYDIYPDDFKELRNKKGFSLSMMADDLDVTLNTVQKWEAGDSIPATKKLAEMAEKYNVSFQITPETLKKHPRLNKPKVQ